jgi:transcriptional repressor of cell division inhibition gene dicB
MGLHKKNKKKCKKKFSCSFFDTKPKLCIMFFMEKTQAIRLAGSQSELAKLLGISQPAVSRWGDRVPKMRVWQLRVLKPEWF